MTHSSLGQMGNLVNKIYQRTKGTQLPTRTVKEKDDPHSTPAQILMSESDKISFTFPSLISSVREREY